MKEKKKNHHRNKSKQDSQENSGTGNKETSNRSAGAETPIYLTSNSTLQTTEEHLHDQSVDARQDTTMEPSNDDLYEIKAGKLTGRDGIGDVDGEEHNR